MNIRQYMLWTNYKYMTTDKTSANNLRLGKTKVEQTVYELSRCTT